MDELYETMKRLLKELYEGDGESVEMDAVTFFRLYKMLCDMMQIRGIVRQNDD